jgi:hypothetical protein
MQSSIVQHGAVLLLVNLLHDTEGAGLKVHR